MILSLSLFNLITVQRLGNAAKEMEYGEGEGNFDIIIVNDDLETAYRQLREFVINRFADIQ